MIISLMKKSNDYLMYLMPGSAIKSQILNKNIGRLVLHLASKEVCKLE